MTGKDRFRPLRIARDGDAPPPLDLGQRVRDLRKAHG